MKILVCGGRYYNDQDRLTKILDKLHHERGIDLLIEGGARGADALGFEWATRKGIQTKTFPADWRRYGRKAGHVRNKQMLEEGKPDAIVAFPGGSGTKNMIEQAEKSGIPVWKIDST